MDRDDRAKFSDRARIDVPAVRSRSALHRPLLIEVSLPVILRAPMIIRDLLRGIAFPCVSRRHRPTQSSPALTGVRLSSAHRGARSPSQGRKLMVPHGNKPEQPQMGLQSKVKVFEGADWRAGGPQGRTRAGSPRGVGEVGSKVGQARAEWIYEPRSKLITFVTRRLPAPSIMKDGKGAKRREKKTSSLSCALRLLGHIVSLAPVVINTSVLPG